MNTCESLIQPEPDEVSTTTTQDGTVLPSNAYELDNQPEPPNDTYPPEQHETFHNG